MAGKRQVKRRVGVRSGGSNKKVVRNKKPVRVEDKPKSNDEVRNDPFGIQGSNQVRTDIAVNLYINTLTYAIMQAEVLKLDRGMISQIGLSFFVRLFDSLSEGKDAEFRRNKLTEILDLYFLTGVEAAGAA